MNFIKKIFNIFIDNKKPEMIKEIYSQPDVILELIKKYAGKDYSLNINIPENIEKIALIASGSSYHSSAIAANFLKNYGLCDVSLYYSSELTLYKDFKTDNDTLYIFVSQSGETVDTNNALNIISARTEKILCITNTKNSTLYDKCKYKMLTYAGTEKAVASTKAMTAQIFCLLLLTAKIMSQKNIPCKDILKELFEVPVYINTALQNINCQEKAKIISSSENLTILASDLFYNVAQEGALKIKETSYINATAYHTGEFLHGHIAILNKKSTVIIIVNNQNYDLANSVLKRINLKYHPEILLIIQKNDCRYNLMDYNSIIIENNSEISLLFSSLTIFQLLACYSAISLNKNVDKPQGLEKIVK